METNSKNLSFEFYPSKYGIDVLTKLADDLLSFRAPGIHFYTINKLEPTKAIVESLKL